MKKSDINVLIVEDDASMRKVLTEAISQRGYKAVSAGKTDEAESIVKIKPIHCVISDVMLPGKNGVDLVIKLKENLMDGTYIVFISGIYKDKSFIAEALKKSEGHEYLVKPFDINKLLDLLDDKLSVYLEAPKVDLHTLLSANLISNRDRRKAIDRLESIEGYNLPFVITILLDSKSSGFLNIVNESQNIYGITFAEGTIVKIDSESTLLFTKKILLQHGFISQSELGEVQSKSADILRVLVDEGLVSPHVKEIVKAETVYNELKNLLPESKLQVNFVPDRKMKSEAGNLDALQFSQQLHDLISSETPYDWLKKFYSVWIGHPIRLGPQFSDYHLYAGFPLLQKNEKLFEQFKKELTLDELMSHNSDLSEDSIMRAVHFLMLKRVLVFEDAKKVKNISEHIARMENIYGELKNKSPIEIIRYFGLTENSNSNDASRVYKDFAKSQHPDVLPQNVSDDIRKMNTELFAKVTSAFEIFSSPEKKEKFLIELKQKEAEKQLKSDELVSAAAMSLLRGRYSEALPMLVSAIEIFESERGLLHLWWAKLKVDGQMSSSEIPKIVDKMRAMSAGTKSTPLYLFVQGLIKRHQNDFQGAYNDFTRTIELDKNFMDARRELTVLKSKNKKSGMQNPFTADVTGILKNFFKKNKGA